MAKYHINNSGDVGECSARAGNCPFGGADEHYTSAEAARTAYESRQGAFVEPAPLKSLTFNGFTYRHVTFDSSVYQSNGEFALMAYSDGDYGVEPLTDVSINLEGLGYKPSSGAFFVKNWGENEGLAEALVKANVIELTGRRELVNQWGSLAVEAKLSRRYSHLVAKARRLGESSVAQ